MGIRFLCQSCDRKIHVKSFLAGKRGICPHCGERVYIPAENQLPSSKESAANAAEQNGDDITIVATATAVATAEDLAAPTNAIPTAAAVPTAEAAPTVTAETASAPDPIDEAPNAIWYVRPPSGGQFGPADAEVMRRWITEGRVSADSLIWREGWDDWMLAEPLFPSLSGAPSPPTAPSSTDTRIGAAVSDVAVTAPATDTASPVASRIRGRRRNTKSMGIAIICVLGVLIVGLAVVLGIVIAKN